MSILIDKSVLMDIFPNKSDMMKKKNNQSSED